MIPPPPLAMAGVAEWNATTGIIGVLRTPDWAPVVESDSWVWSWVMQTGFYPDGGWWVQVGWFVGGDRIPQVVEEAWVTGPQGWAHMQWFPQIPLTAGSDHTYAVVSEGADVWAVVVDGVVLDRFNVPSGPTAHPQAFTEVQGTPDAAPDMRSADLQLRVDGVWGPWNAGCMSSAGTPLSIPARLGCSTFYTRLAA